MIAEQRAARQSSRAAPIKLEAVNDRVKMRDELFKFGSLVQLTPGTVHVTFLLHSGARRVQLCEPMSLGVVLCWTTFETVASRFESLVVAFPNGLGLFSWPSQHLVLL